MLITSIRDDLRIVSRDDVLEINYRSSRRGDLSIRI